MAQVTIDISEYDALRLQNEERRQKIEKLESEIEDIKKSSRALIRKEVKIPDFNFNSIYQYYTNTYTNYHFGLGNVRDVCDFAQGYFTDLVLRGNLKLHSDSQQYVNFDDIVNQVREEITAETKRELSDREYKLNELSKKYNQTEEEVYKRCKEQFDQDINKLKKTYTEKFEAKKEEIATIKKELKYEQGVTRGWKMTVENYSKLNWIQRLFINIKTKNDE